MNAKILVACANGAGTSLMMKMTCERVTKKLGMGVSDIHHCALSEGVSCARQYDIVFSPLNFKDMYADAEKAGVTIIGLRNVLSDKEMETALVETGMAEKFKA
ncbi:MAG: PTS sugar transporter subunit IIB [Coriobacteriaceae bacterium]|uniref:PTS sugar transporter subunit IIB n=1 Tax=Tractidigestivibacter sp. TaxID=2847320 RepID=UPI002A90915F|nr:PTS sugar transporter subunit IIB [Tractidigestivibacter sp.]MCI6273192.1 PTS sugar transporter subunit IIB [Coriobacteriaceae bacterium]MCI6845098.1 PTS sugar transporter subunit IIB [Coriobacteriaceae bacterium]MCI7438605.1 PTS sugar transporter subunit IIB [Coriobacteriaceae bacterium]MDD7584781.1 PTS sugar transporter subunit IIB [Coriobacteriaceae bacterium]MDY5271414.1 PTS sugar transporter subunit IIB [Tractidigestivibacter sp.]